MATNKVIIDVVAKGTQKATKNLGGVAKKIAGIGMAYMGAQGLISGIKGSLDAFGRQELAEKKLEQALGKTSDALLRQASSLQKVTRFGDEATIEQMAFLGSIGMTEDQIKSIIPVAMDLAEATGMSLESAVRNTAKTFSGMAGELGELVPQIRTLTKEQMMSGEAVKVMGNLFKGQATASANTYTGQLEQLSNAVGDTAEAIGEILIPVIIPLVDTMKFLAEGTQSFINAIKSKEEIEEVVKLFSQVEVDAEKFAETLEGKTLPQLLAINNALLGMDGLQLTKDEFDLLILKSDKLNKVMNKIVEDALEQDNTMTDLSTRKIERSKFEFEQIEGNTNAIAEGEKAYAEIVKKAEEDKARAREQSAIAIGSSSTNMAESIRSVIKAYLMEAIAGMLAKEIAGKGLAGLITGTIGATAVNMAFESLIPKFAEHGMNEVVTEPTMIIAGENGAESVNITPLGGGGTAEGGINLHFNAPVTNADFIRDVVIPEINNARRLGLA